MPQVGVPEQAVDEVYELATLTRPELIAGKLRRQDESKELSIISLDGSYEPEDLGCLKSNLVNVVSFPMPHMNDDLADAFVLARMPPNMVLQGFKDIQVLRSDCRFEKLSMRLHNLLNQLCLVLQLWEQSWEWQQMKREGLCSHSHGCAVQTGMLGSTPRHSTGVD